MRTLIASRPTLLRLPGITQALSDSCLGGSVRARGQKPRPDALLLEQQLPRRRRSRQWRSPDPASRARWPSRPSVSRSRSVCAHALLRSRRRGAVLREARRRGSLPPTAQASLRRRTPRWSRRVPGALVLGSALLMGRCTSILVRQIITDNRLGTGM